jgi:signal transduction histidine kinase
LSQIEKDGRTFLLLRYVLIIAAAYLFLFEGKIGPSAVCAALIAAALLSNLLLSTLAENVLLSSRILGVILCADVAWIAAGLWHQGYAEPDIFFLYFFILFLATTRQHLILIVSAAVLLSTVDLILIVIPAGDAHSIWTSSSLIRVPFLFVVALFYGHLAEKIKQERARALKEKDLAEERIRALHDIDLAITSTLDLRSVLEVLLEKIDLFYPGRPTTVRLLDKKSGALEATACRNINEEEWKAATAGIGGGLRRMLADATVPLIVRDAQADPRSLSSDFLCKEGVVSYLRVPLTAKGEVLGVLTFLTREAHEFSKDEVEFLTTLAGQAAIAIHNAQLYEQTRDQAAELERADKAKDEFLGIMSHELRTPLNVIQGYAAMLKDGAFGKINLEQETVLQRIFNHAKNELNMVNDLLQVSRLGADGGSVLPVATNPGDILEELKFTYETNRSKEPALKWDYPADLPVIKTDSEKLKHILQNLINNAIKFTEKGRITVSARYFPADNELKFIVTDTGIGIPTEKIPIIFDMFRQVESSRARMYGGVGLGLYIVRKFTDLLGGKVEVESVPNQGSSFTVRLTCQKWN